jgi:hypothetical protein
LRSTDWWENGVPVSVSFGTILVGTYSPRRGLLRQRGRDPKRCHPLEAPCQVGRVFPGRDAMPAETKRRGIVPISSSKLWGLLEGAEQLSAESTACCCRLDGSSPSDLPARPDFQSSWSQPSAAPATHQDQGDGVLREEISGPWRHPAPQKALELCRLSPSGQRSAGNGFLRGVPTPRGSQPTRRPDDRRHVHTSTLVEHERRETSTPVKPIRAWVITEEGVPNAA